MHPICNIIFCTSLNLGFLFLKLKFLWHNIFILKKIILAHLNIFLGCSKKFGKKTNGLALFHVSGPSSFLRFGPPLSPPCFWRSRRTSRGEEKWPQQEDQRRGKKWPQEQQMGIEPGSWYSESRALPLRHSNSLVEAWEKTDGWEKTAQPQWWLATTRSGREKTDGWEKRKKGGKINGRRESNSGLQN